jgi:hypothetical protein
MSSRYLKTSGQRLQGAARMFERCERVVRLALDQQRTTA